MILSLLILIVSAYVVYEVVKGRGRPSLCVLAVVNAIIGIWNVLS